MKMTLEHLAGFLFVALGYGVKFIPAPPETLQELHLTQPALLGFGAFLIAVAPKLFPGAPTPPAGGAS